MPMTEPTATNAPAAPDPAPLAELACALADDLNPLDLASLRVTLDGQALEKDRLTVKPLTPDGKSVRVAVKRVAVLLTRGRMD